MPIKNNLTEVSKTISYHLRHKPLELDLQLDLEGWVELNNFLDKFNTHYKLQFGQVTIDDIQEILDSSDKKRFEINDTKIRAKYGHSVDKIDKIKLEYPVLRENIVLFHGTAAQNLPTIKKEGLKTMSRQFVHLTDSVEIAKQTALRKSPKVVILTIDTINLIKFQQILVVESGIYLSQNILPEFLLFGE